MPDGAERRVLRSDASAETPKLTASMRELLDSLSALCGSDAAMAKSLANVQSVTDQLKGQQGTLGVFLDNEGHIKNLMATIDGAYGLLACADVLDVRLDTLKANAGRQVLRHR